MEGPRAYWLLTPECVRAKIDFRANLGKIASTA
jgi:hypothetical protein